MMKRYNVMKYYLISVENDEYSNIVLDRLAAFKKAAKSSKQLGEINFVTIELQNQCITLTESCLLQEELIYDVYSGNPIPESAL